MTAYNTSPFGPSPVLMVGGRTEFLYGGFSDTTSPTYIAVSSVANSGTVATVVGTIVSGNAPTVGSLVSIQGTKTNSGEFNVTNVALASVTTNATTGVTTITFPLTGTVVTTTTDSGFAVVPTPLTFDTLVAGSSKQRA